MFPAEKKGEWEPLKVREKKIRKPSIPDITLGKDGQDDPLGGPNGTMNGEGPKVDDAEEETLYEEDSTSEEGAVFPLKDGRVVNWSCFFALLTHVYNTLSPPFHTPILVIAQPAWTEQDHETLTQFFFEKFKTPAFCLMDSALAVCYAFGVPTATVVDVGYGKCDVTAVNDFLVNDIGRGIALHGCGGEGMTQRLLDLLSSKGFTRDMCEQLKKSTISEILPPGTDLPTGTGTTDNVTNPAAVASTGAIGSGSGQRVSIAAQGGAPRGPGLDTDVGDDDHDREIKDGEDNDGVLDVASIVASGKTSEFLAKKEREKAERAAAKKAAVDAAAAPKAVRLPNSKREKAILHYEERRPLEELNGNGKRAADGDGTQEGGESKRQKTPEPVNEATDGPAPARKEERRRNRANATFVRKDVEVGIERFKAADGGILDQIADSIHRSILSVPEVNKRSELWDSLIILGNGSKVRGKKTLPPFPPTSLSTPSSYSIKRNNTIPSHPRLQRRPPLHPPHKIPHLPFQRHNLHLRTPLQPLHPPRHRRQHPPPPTPTLPPRRRRQLWREPPPPRRHHSLQPHPRPAPQPRRPPTPALPAPTPTIPPTPAIVVVVVVVVVAAAAAAAAFQPRANPHVDQVRQDARVFLRVEGCRDRGGGVSRRPGRRQGYFRRRSGLK